jgi:hypothetical protein
MILAGSAGWGRAWGAHADLCDLIVEVGGVSWPRSGCPSWRRTRAPSLGVALNQVSPFRVCRVWVGPLDGAAIDRASCPPEPLSRNGSVVTTSRIITAPFNGWGATCNSTLHASQRD